MILSQRLLWQLFSALLLLLSLNHRISGFAQAQEQVTFAEPGLDGTFYHIEYAPNTEPNSPRHIAEKERVLEWLKRPEGPEEGELKQDHPRYRLLQAMHGYLRYQERYITQLQTWEKSYNDLPEAQRKVIDASTNYKENFEIAKKAWEDNGHLADDILLTGLAYYEVEDEELNDFVEDNEGKEVWDNQGAITDAVNHYIRDWSSDGLHERIPTFDPILETIKKHFPDRATRKEGPVTVLIPGQGLGRLPHDVAALGNMEVTSNEYSYYMNLAYRYIETLAIPNSVKFHPYQDWWSYQTRPAERAAEVTIPDVPVNASSVLLREGDFMHIFDHQTGYYDVVVSLYFIDTAKNTLDYIDNINRLLKPGGLWINLGPLLYGSNPITQFSLEEIVQVSEGMGFKFLDTDEKWGSITLPGRTVRSKDINYLVNPRGLRKNIYSAQFWVAEKVHRDYDEFPKSTEKSSTPEHTFNT
ncbi:hypothetical protein FKW77_004204 [Venturia effusa]|uniref:Uncharacterized protein n=1 Tax=Venturia effusa TaxID=50376 RepID=A0A517LQ18_9PEZI|nr:hypothetical protein FKW77_004204 [Venturia effusa]